MNMKEFDRIIGYDVIKKELERIADTLRNPEHYSCLGVTPPCGLLLYGEPGVGKSTMANALIEASGRPVFLCRRDRPDGDFVWTVNHTFADAVQAAPSIVFLDDLDKFSKSEEGCGNQEEYVAVQAGIDSVRGKNVFVLATANEIYLLPDSLQRPGRFDQIIKVDEPSLEEAKQIASHYLMGKAVEPDVDVETIARMLSGRSCAALETAVNSAGIYAGFERSKTITMRHMLMGCLETAHHVSPDLIIHGRTDDANDPECEMTRVACHEAGHAVVSEVLRPGSVSFVCIHESRNDSRGFTSAHARNNSFDKLSKEVTCAVAGAAALDQRFGITDIGASGDFEEAKNILWELIAHDGYCGFPLLESTRRDSDQLLMETEKMISIEMYKHYSEAKRILASNMDFLKTMIVELLDKGLLTRNDIQRIKESCAKAAG